MPKVAFKQCDVERALRAATACGLKVTGFEIAPDSGNIRVLTGEAAAPQSSAPDPYEQWKNRRGDRAA